MMKRLVIVNSDSRDFSYGGVAPIMRNMHPFLSEAFQVEYLYLPDSWKNIPGPNRFKMLIYLFGKMRSLNNGDFILSHIPEGSFIASFSKTPYAHIYHGNTNPMMVSRYRFGKYFSFVFELFFKRIAKTASLRYTVGPVFDNVKKLYNPIFHNVKPVPYEERRGFIFSGRLESVKNIDRLIRIYSILPESVRKEHHFYIAGMGTLEKALKELVCQLGMAEQIHFLGSLANDQLIKEDSTKRILLMASSYEGLPTAIAEAFTLGLPVVTTDVGDIPLVVKDNVNGFLFHADFKDEDYAAAIVAILNDYERFSKIALLSSKVFDAEKITAGIIKDINFIIGNRTI